MANFKEKDLTRTIWKRGDTVEVQVNYYGYNGRGSWGRQGPPVTLRGVINDIERDRLHLRTSSGEWHEVYRNVLVSIRPLSAAVIDDA